MKTLNEEQGKKAEGCYLCGDDDGDGRKPFGGVGRDIRILETWSLRCVESISCLFRIPVNDPVRQVMKDADYCQKCIQVVRDIDFTLRLFKQLLGKLEVLQNKMLDKVAQKEIKDFGEHFEREISKLLREGSADINVGIDRFKHLLNLESLRNDSGNNDTSVLPGGLVQHSSRTVKRKVSNEVDNEQVDIKEEKIYVNFDQEEVDLFEEQNWIILSKEEGNNKHKSGDPLGRNLSDSDNNCQTLLSDDDNSKDNTNSDQKRTRRKRKLIKVKRFRCSLCPALAFGSDLALNGHRRSVHEFDPTPYHCDKCPKKLKQLKSLKLHKMNNCPFSLNSSQNNHTDPQPTKSESLLSDSEVLNPQIRRSSARVTVKREINSIPEKDDQDDDNATNLEDDNQYPSDKDDDYKETGEQDEEEDSASDSDFSDDDLSDESDEDYHRRQRGRKNRGSTSIKKLQCRLCPALFMAEATLKGHQLGVHENDPLPFHCVKCPKKFRKYKTLRSHTNRNCQNEVVQPSQSIPCISCPKKFSTYTSLRKHTNLLHSELYCSFCALNFPTLEMTQTHEELHKNFEQPFQCTLCQSVFPNSLKLKDHVALSHMDTRVVCEICGGKFASTINLRKHLATHNDSYVGHKCEICGLVNQSVSCLAQHMLKHSKSKNFTCETCGAGYIYPASLKRHKINHLAQLPCICKICDKAFACKQFLLKHEEIHSGTLSYECPACNKKFKTKNSLNQHVKIHDPKDPNRKKRARINRQVSVIEQVQKGHE